MAAFDKLGELFGRAVADLARFFLNKCLFPFMDQIGTELMEMNSDLVASLEANPALPPEVKSLLNKAKEGKGQGIAIVGSLLASAGIGGPMSASLFPFLEGIKQSISAKQPFQPVPIINLMILRYRGLIEPEFFYQEMARFGINSSVAELMYTSYQFYPAPQDLINWIAKEVFEPDQIAKFGLEEEVPMGQADLFKKAGVTPEQLRNFWIAHWVHPSFGEVARLFQREQIEKSTFWEWFRLVEIPPIWRDGLIEITWDTPNRVETRMMCRYLDMAKSDVVKLLQYAGLKEEYRSDSADFMIIMGIEGDLRTRYRNGWISSDEVKSELTRRGVSATIAERVYERIVKEEKPERLAAERDLTKAEIVKGVKKGVISWDEGAGILMEMGYDQTEAHFILEINIGATTGSPENKAEFMKWAELHQAASGIPTKRPWQEVAKAEAKSIAERGKTRIPSEEEVKIQTDTIRRRRRKNLITRDQEIAALLELGWDLQYATAAADNDDIRLAEKAGEE